jgi:hypothetical protein
VACSLRFREGQAWVGVGKRGAEEMREVFSSSSSSSGSSSSSRSKRPRAQY